MLSEKILIALSFEDNPVTIEIDLNNSLDPNEDNLFLGNNLTLLGGDIDIRDSQLSLETITFAALDGSGTINIEEGNLSFPENVANINSQQRDWV